jgi:hypothetical protein
MSGSRQAAPAPAPAPAPALALPALPAEAGKLDRALHDAVKAFEGWRGAMETYRMVHKRVADLEKGQLVVDPSVRHKNAEDIVRGANTAAEAANVAASMVAEARTVLDEEREHEEVEHEEWQRRILEQLEAMPVQSTAEEMKRHAELAEAASARAARALAAQQAQQAERAAQARAARALAAQQVVVPAELVAFKDKLILLYLGRDPVWVDAVGMDALMAFKACVDGELQRRDITVPHWPPVARREAYPLMPCSFEKENRKRPQVLEYLHQILDSLDDSSSEKQFVQSVLDVAICVKALTNDTGFYSTRYVGGPMLRGHREWFSIAMLGIQAVSAACRDVHNLEPDHADRVDGEETTRLSCQNYLEELRLIPETIYQPPIIGNFEDLKRDLANGVI